MHLPFLFNWELNPYHTPIVVAQKMGFYAENDITLALLEPNDPTDVTKIIGRGDIKLGLKAMVHCFAARDRGYPIKSIGTLLDEPPTGFISLKHKNITTLSDLKGKRIGYVGEFGKVMLDHIAQQAGIAPDAYETYKIGMHCANAILSDEVDAAIGLSCYQQLEVEASGEMCDFLRIDHLANLGCCCFCSIQFIVHESLIQTDAEILGQFMAATLKGMQFTRESPKEAFKILVKAKPTYDNPLYEKIFYHCLPFFSKDLKNVERDWHKVGAFAKKLNILSNDGPNACYTNQFVPVPVSCEVA